MRFSSFHIALFVGVLIAAHFAPALKAVTSCCDERVCSIQEAGLLMQTSPAVTPPERDDLCCDFPAAEETHSADRGCDTKGQQDPHDRAPRDSDTPGDPCDGDCRCTLCRITMHHPIQVSTAPSIRLAAEEVAELAWADQLICSRDQRFDLLRPPQF